MRKLISLLVFAVVVAGGWTQVAHAGAVRISQIYSGGGDDASVGTPYSADYIELLNAGGSAVDVSGWLLAYGGTGTTSFGCSGCTKTIPAGTTIQPCGYLLFQVGPISSVGFGAHLPTPDATLLIGFFGITSSGVIALLSSGAPTGMCISGQVGVEDLVGWGGVSCPSGVTPPGIDSAHALLRKNGGMTSTGNNVSDFVLGAATPRNAAAPQSAICLQTPARPSSWGNLKSVYR